MLRAVFNGHETFLMLAVLASLALAIAAFFFIRKIGAPAWSGALFFGCLALAFSVTLFFPGGGGGKGQCIVNRNLGEPFATEQGLLNLAMFIPIGLFGIFLFRRLVPLLAGAFLVPVVVELVQGVVPGVSRNCDSSDVQMNFIGAVIGVVAGWLILRAGRRSLVPANQGIKQILFVAGGTLLACGVVWKMCITPVAVDSTSLQIAGSKEETAARKAMTEAFGDRYDVVNVQVQPGYRDGPATLLIALKDGSATLSWPDPSHFNASLESSSAPGTGSYPVSSDHDQPNNKNDAFLIAKQYAAEKYPWALPNSTYQVSPVGEKAEFGWLVSWRHVVDGVLMPMRLDVQINRAGRVSQLNVQKGESKVTVPPKRITADQAEDLVRKTMSDSSGVTIKATRLVAEQRKGQWRALWVVNVIMSENDSYGVYVDAESGAMDDSTGST
ncbi:VanZ family protein [Streptomyces sp. DT171]|uniref:VanZ family protein n=1 Tax=Streptomyces sp. DT171 TaxID=3416524 RepID=UPI003CEB00FC